MVVSKSVRRSLRFAVRLPPMSQHPCEAPSAAVQLCHLCHGIQGEECVREELREKRCLAELLCRQEARRFYYDPIRRGGGSEASCSTLVESFAFEENEGLLPDNVGGDDKQHCRAIVHELAKCLSRYRVGRR